MLDFNKSPPELTSPADEDPNPSVQTAVYEVPVTIVRPPWNPTETDLVNPGTARANIAASASHPDGTQRAGWASAHAHQTVLQQHCAFFDSDGDGVIWPLDTYRAFAAMGFGFSVSVISTILIHASFSYATMSHWLPDPCFRIYLARIHQAKHGSDSAAFDNEGRFISQKFEDFWSKYAQGRDVMTVHELWHALAALRVLNDWFGHLAALLEWHTVYLLLWPADGIIRKDDVRRVYDGSIFPEMAAKYAAKKKAAQRRTD